MIEINQDFAAVPQGAWPVLAVKLNEPVVRPMPQDENGLFSMDALPKLLALAEKADALLIGCGLGRSDTLTEIACTLLEKAKCQIVLDADGINSITGHKDILRRTAKPVSTTAKPVKIAAAASAIVSGII